MHRRHQTFLRILSSVLGVLLGVTIAQAGERWFPKNGSAAIHQRCLDVERPTVAMIVALQPGYEDLPLMAYLRTRIGAKVVVVFLTNGEATPGDTLARYPVWMTGERKLEADRVASLLDAEAWFANIPDLASPTSVTELGAAWDTVGATKRLVRTIRTFQPDLISLCTDQRVNGMESLRDRVAQKTVREAVISAATTVDTSRSDNVLPWSVSRMFVQRKAGTVPPVFEKKHLLLHISSLAMARSVSQQYRTLRLAIGNWVETGREYHALTPAGVVDAASHPDEMLKNLPRVSAKTADIGKAIRSAISSDTRGIRSASLPTVSAAIDAAEHVLVQQSGMLSAPERRLMVTWKNGLEALRCAVLDVTVTVTVSESLLTASQLWYLKVEPVKPLPRNGATEIFFPLASNGEWIVNESMKYHFPMDSATSFTMLSASELPFTLPAAEYGLTQPVMSTRFPYVIVHKNAKREHNYMYRGVVTLQFGPRRSFAVRTPLVFDDPQSSVIVEMQNFSRDRFRGSITLSDTSGHSIQVPVALLHKDHIVTDTLHLPGNPSSQEGQRPLTVELSGRGGRQSITAMRFSALIDSSTNVGIISTIDNSPLVEALRVVRQPHTSVSLNGTAGSLKNIKTVLVDRDLLSDMRCTGATKRELGEWIREGGNAVVFPQYGEGAQWLLAFCGATFQRINPLPPDADMTVDTSALFRTPNRIEAKDWDGWVQARAFVKIVQKAPHAGASVRAECGEHPLVLSLAVGKGTVTCVAADLLSQCVNYHPGAHRLLANLMSTSFILSSVLLH